MNWWKDEDFWIYYFITIFLLFRKVSETDLNYRIFFFFQFVTLSFVLNALNEPSLSTPQLNNAFNK